MATFTSSEVEAILKAQQGAFESSLKVFMDSVNTRIDGFLKEVCEIRFSVESVRSEVAAIASLATSSPDFTKLEERVEQLASQTDYLENQSRRNNLRIDGIGEDPYESWEQTESKVNRVIQ